MRPPLAVLAAPDGMPVGKAENKDGMLKVGDVEKLVNSEVKRREAALSEKLKTGRDKAKAGDTDAVTQLFRAVLDEQCMFPKPAKEAGKELKKLGASESSSIPAAPIFDARQIQMIAGLISNAACGRCLITYMDNALNY